MKMVSYLNGGNERAGLLYNNEIFALPSLHPLLPATMSGFLENWNLNLPIAENVCSKN